MRKPWLLLFSSFVVTGLGIFGLAAGCGTSPAKQSSTSDAGDASTADVVAEAAVDAGIDINQDPNVYPSQHHPIPQIDYNGGPVLTHPRIVTVSFVGDPHRDSWRAFDHLITTTQWWTETAEGFCIDGGTYNGQCVGGGTTAAPDGGEWLPDGSTADAGDGYLDVEIPYDYSSMAITDDDIQTWLALHVGNGDFPPPDPETIYALYFPTTTSISPGGGSPPLCAPEGYGVILGYHNQTTVMAVGSSTPQQVAYAVLPYCDLGAGDLGNFEFATTTASHEIAEAATDPQPDQLPAYYLHSNDAWAGANSIAGGECGDLCENVNNNTYDESGYTVQRIWSNQAAAQSMNPCQPWPNTYYGAALRTTPQMIEGHESDGYVVVKRGQSVNVIADVFAQKALPHDLALYVGQNKGPYETTDPSDVAAPGDGITVTLSQTQVNNGDGIIVTFAVPSSGSTGDYAMVIRSVLESNDYNDWPVIVHVE
jgi:hypothetical protein